MASSREQLASALKDAFTKVEKTYAKYADGTIVRTNGSSREELIAFLKYRRAYTLDEILEELGVGWAKFMIEKGYAAHTGAGIFMITTKAVETYNLPTRHHEGWNLKILPFEKAINKPLPATMRGRQHLVDVKYAA